MQKIEKLSNNGGEGSEQHPFCRVIIRHGLVGLYRYAPFVSLILARDFSSFFGDFLSSHPAVHAQVLLEEQHGRRA